MEAGRPVSAVKRAVTGVVGAPFCTTVARPRRLEPLTLPSEGKSPPYASVRRSSQGARPMAGSLIFTAAEGSSPAAHIGPKGRKIAVVDHVAPRRHRLIFAVEHRVAKPREIV